MPKNRRRDVKLYHAVTDLKLAERYYKIINPIHPDLSQLNILVSFTYFKNQLPMLLRLKRERKIASTFLDAGTFGMNKKGSNPGLKKLMNVYLSWIYQIGQHFDYISSFDDRFNETGHNFLNYEDMKGALSAFDAAHGTSLAPKLVPVIHSQDKDEYESYETTPAEEVLSYIEEGAKTIGIGSSPMIGPNGMEELKELCAEYDIRIHRFGNFDYEFISTHEIDSADSGRYFRSTQYGRDVWFWDEDNTNLVKISIRTKAIPPEYKAMLKRVFGWDWSDLLGKVDRIWMVNLFAHQQAQQYLTSTFAI